MRISKALRSAQFISLHRYWQHHSDKYPWVSFLMATASSRAAEIGCMIIKGLVLFWPLVA